MLTCKPSEKIRNILSTMFPQNGDFEHSIFPINIDYTIPFAEMSGRRIIVNQTDGATPNDFLGDIEQIRNFSFDVIVASPDSNESWSVANTIYNYLKKYKDDEYIRIRPIGDISPMGQNAKKLWLYVCTYAIQKNN